MSTTRQLRRSQKNYIEGRSLAGYMTRLRFSQLQKDLSALGRLKAKAGKNLFYIRLILFVLVGLVLLLTAGAFYLLTL